MTVNFNFKKILFGFLIVFVFGFFAWTNYKIYEIVLVHNNFMTNHHQEMYNQVKNLCKVIEQTKN